MARVRPARRCCARTTAGAPCKCYAMQGGRVCRVHGGAAPQVREAAKRRLLQRRLEEGFQRDWEAYQERYREWHIRRCTIAAEHLGIAPEQLTPALLGWASAMYPDVDRLDDAPQLRMDRRRGPRWAK